MNKILIIPLVAIYLTACSGGGGSSTPAATNPSGFPDVAGRYSLNTSTVNGSCSDGSTASNPAIALNFDITQNANVITLLNTSAGSGVPGITFIDSTDLTGNVQTNSSFIVSQIATANIDGISGTVNLNYNLTGNFASNGWSGTYTYSASSSSLGTCTFTSSFTGTKITNAKAIVQPKQLNINNNLPVDFYDQFSIIGSSIAVDK